MGDGSSEISNLLTSIYYLQDLLTPIFYLEDLLTSIFYAEEPPQPLALRPAEDADEKTACEDSRRFRKSDEWRQFVAIHKMSTGQVPGELDIGEEGRQPNCRCC